MLDREPSGGHNQKSQPLLCLGEDELLSWVTGKLTEDRVVELESHLDDCDLCQAVLGEALRRSGDDVSPSATDQTFRAGELVGERYRVVRFIARGGMGEVYEVYDSWLRDVVALKTLVANIADNPTALARLKAEVLLARKVSHPNVCRIFDLGFHERCTPGSLVSERIAFLTMELLGGETLKARLRREGALSLSQVRQIAAQLVAGMSHAHASRIVHRDFKSDNVMLVEGMDGLRAVVTDFGLARTSLTNVLESLTSSGHAAVGTLDYMAPEQLAGKPATNRSDIYAFGVVLFEMCTGRLPFKEKSPLARMINRVQTPAPSVRSVVPEVPVAWDAAIARCLEMDPDRRFEHVDQLLVEIERSEGQVPQARRAGRLPVAAVAALMAVVASVGFRAIETEPQEAPQSVEPPRAALVAKPTAERVAPSPSPTEEPAADVLPKPAAAVSAPAPRVLVSPARRAPSREMQETKRVTLPDDGLLDPFGAGK